jgi:hypothetical protein
MVAGPNPTTIYVRRVKETKIVDPLTIHVILTVRHPTCRTISYASSSYRTKPQPG